ncbi:MAG: nucleoside phosphorylase [Ginsengibacter sp.]
MEEILAHKFYKEQSVFLPKNLLREARRQKNLKDCAIPAICLLDPDGDLVTYLLKNNRAEKNECWACYHSMLYTFHLDDIEVGIIPCVVGAPYAVLVAEQLFVSGCRLLISITSAGIIKQPDKQQKFALITSSIRDEGTSYHYLPKDQHSVLTKDMASLLITLEQEIECPFFSALSWTTDAPYRETTSSIEIMRNLDVTCVEMEAAALYALSEYQQYNIICFAHITNSMAQSAGDFEKGEEFGSIDTLNLISYILKKIPTSTLKTE